MLACLAMQEDFPDTVLFATYLVDYDCSKSMFHQARLEPRSHSDVPRVANYTNTSTHPVSIPRGFVPVYIKCFFSIKERAPGHLSLRPARYRYIYSIRISSNSSRRKEVVDASYEILRMLYSLRVTRNKRSRRRSEGDCNDASCKSRLPSPPSEHHHSKRLIRTCFQSTSNVNEPLS